MIQAIALTFLAGLMGTNGIPHFVQGITAREYPNPDRQLADQQRGRPAWRPSRSPAR